MNKPTITALITIQETNNSNLPDAHLKDFCGKPLYQHMVDKLLAVPAIHRIVITTDSAKVRNAFTGNNRISLIDFPNPSTFPDDVVARILAEMPTSDRNTANSLDKAPGDHFLQTQCINPLLTVQTIQAAIDRYYEYVINDQHRQFDSLMSLYRIEKRLYDSSNYPTITLRDDPHFVIYEDTVFNLFSREHFNRNGKKKFGRNPMFFEVPELESLAVESPTSYQLARLAFENARVFG